MCARPVAKSEVNNRSQTAISNNSQNIKTRTNDFGRRRWQTPIVPSRQRPAGISGVAAGLPHADMSVLKPLGSRGKIPSSGVRETSRPNRQNIRKMPNAEFVFLCDGQKCRSVRSGVRNRKYQSVSPHQDSAPDHTRPKAVGRVGTHALK